MIDDIKRALAGDKTGPHIPIEKVLTWLTALVEYYEAAESYIRNPSSSNERELREELRDARKKLEGK